jgi:hypothetical protein
MRVSREGEAKGLQLRIKIPLSHGLPLGERLLKIDKFHHKSFRLLGSMRKEYSSFRKSSS